MMIGDGGGNLGGYSTRELEWEIETMEREIKNTLAMPNPRQWQDMIDARREKIRNIRKELARRKRA